MIQGKATSTTSVTVAPSQCFTSVPRSTFESSFSSCSGLFLARLRSVARRGSAPRPTLLRVADLALDPARRQATRGERDIHLSPTEFRLLELLMRRSGRVVPRDSIVEAVWEFDNDVEENMSILSFDYRGARYIMHFNGLTGGFQVALPCCL